MSTSTSNTGDSKFRISLSDIRGVGEQTIEKLATVDITTVEDLHLCQNGEQSTTANRLERNGHTIPSSTWEHIAAVGKAVKFSRRSNVEAKHLTGDIVSNRSGYESVDITTQESNSTDNATLSSFEAESSSLEENDLLPSINEENVDMLFNEAINAIQNHYIDGEQSTHSERVSFEADYSRFLHNNDAATAEKHELPEPTRQSIIVHQNTGDYIRKHPKYSEECTRILVLFAKTHTDSFSL